MRLSPAPRPRVPAGSVLIEMAAPDLRASERALTSDYLTLLAQRSRLMADVTGTDVSPGDDVVIIGQQDDQRLDVREIAATIGSIPWEILCRIGSRIERVYQ